MGESYTFVGYYATCSSNAMMRAIAATTCDVLRLANNVNGTVMHFGIEKG